MALTNGSDEFINLINEEWLKIPKTMIINIINNIPRRIQMVIDANGNWIKY